MQLGEVVERQEPVRGISDPNHRLMLYASLVPERPPTNVCPSNPEEVRHLRQWICRQIAGVAAAVNENVGFHHRT
jgi:hypothetical protein